MTESDKPGPQGTRAPAGELLPVLPLRDIVVFPHMIVPLFVGREEPSKLADTVASHLNLKIAEKQELLEIQKIGERLERVFGHMESEIGVLQVEKRIRNRVKRQMEKTQREYYLNEQLKAIQKELGEGEDGKDENAELEAK